MNQNAASAQSLRRAQGALPRAKLEIIPFILD